VAARRCASGIAAINAVAIAAAAATGMPSRTTRFRSFAANAPGRENEGVSTAPLIRKNT
jgi:hypothetical protein